MNEELLEALCQLIEVRFSGLTKPIRKNLVVSTFAFILVLSAHRKVPVDVIVYDDPTYEEPWYLLVPIAYRTLLETSWVVDLYRERMQIEQSFRDFKTHLGLRGLKLQIDIAPGWEDCSLPSV